jgi:hypothetical protein
MFQSNSPFNRKESNPQVQRDLERIYQQLSDLYAEMEHRHGRYDELTSQVADVRDDVYALLR